MTALGKRRIFRSITPILIFLAVGAGVGLAGFLDSANSESDDNRQAIAGVMHAFYADLVSLKPFLVNPESFQNPKNEKVIKERITKMATDVRNAQKKGVLGSALHKVSMRAFYEHMNELEAVFNKGNKQYAHWMLNSMTSLCVSCHTQLPQSSDPKLVEAKDYKKLTGERLFREAEFYFVTRRFDLAEDGFRRVIAGYPGNKVSSDDLETAMRRVLAVFARVKRDPQTGSARMAEALANKKLPVYLRKNAEAWMGAFNRWSKEKRFDVTNAKSDVVLKFANAQLKPSLWDKMSEAGSPRVVTFLRVSGILYEFLSQHKKDENTAEMLLLLSRCEQQLNNEFFFSLADLYLRECIVNHSKDPAAKKCFAQYEENVVASYSGSSGTHVPADVRRSLKKLRAMVYPEKK